jgi:hypothetical protein
VETILREAGCWKEWDRLLSVGRRVKEDRLEDNLLLEEWLDELTMDHQLSL